MKYKVQVSLIIAFLIMTGSVMSLYGQNNASNGNGGIQQKRPNANGTPTPSPTPTPAPGGFKILVDTNQINATESLQASLLGADGTWVNTGNSTGVNWSTTLGDIGPLSVSENLYTFNGIPHANPAVGINAYEGYMGHAPTAIMGYNDGSGGTTLLTAAQVAYYRSFGPGVILLARSYGVPATPVADIQTALNYFGVVGLAFEFNPLNGGCTTPADCSIAQGVEYVLSQEKQCYLLLPPAATATTSYLAAIQELVSYLQSYDPTLLRNPNLFFVPAVYVRPSGIAPGYPNGVHFIGSDQQAIEMVVQYLQGVRASL